MFGTRWSVMAVLGFALAACSHARPAAQKEPAEPPVAARQQGGTEQGMDGRCPGPMAMQGTTVAEEDTASGAAVTFTTTGDVEELRHRVHAMADMHNAHHGGEAAEDERVSTEDAAAGDTAGSEGAAKEPKAGDTGEAESAAKEPQGEATGETHGAMSGMHGDAGEMHGGMGEMHGGMTDMHGVPDSTASVEDVDGGARVYVTPKNPADLDELRTAVRSHIEHMKTAKCGTSSGTGMN